ncbi:MAG: ATP-binding protein [Eubacteriales bacterium]|nr:ATP-binding protein [Eubacteriales bacterium]
MTYPSFKDLKFNEQTMPAIEAMAEGIPGGFFIYHADGDEEFIFVNSKMHRLCGCSTEEEFRELTHNSFRGFVYEEDLEKTESSIWDQINAGAEAGPDAEGRAAGDIDIGEGSGNAAGAATGEDHVKYRVKTRDGRMLWIDDYGQLVHTEEFGDVFFVFVVDFSEAHSEEEAREQAHRDEIIEKNKMLEAALIKAEAASRAKTTFLFNMSHDIRTPMNAIIGFTDLLEKAINEPEKREDYLKKIHSSNKYLLDIINNVLEMARVESGKVTLQEVPWSTELLGNAIVSMFSDMLEKKQLSFVCETDDVEHKYFYCDPTRIKEICMNIVSNAVKYTPNGGAVTVKLRELATGERTQAGQASGRVTYEFKVSDTGIGISGDYLPHIFEEFTREKNTTESKVIGTGLGMSITKRLVDLMGGTIAVESELGKGSTFTVTISFREAQKSDLDEIHKSAEKFFSESFEGKRILLAEDNELNAEIAIEILKGVGLKAELAEDGAICVEKLKNSAPGYYDMILMDIQMPNMNGYTATKTIRSLDDTLKAGIPIYAMTANAFEEDKQDAAAAGMNGHLSKPIDIPLLMETLAKTLK